MMVKKDDYVSYDDALKEARQQQATPRMERLKQLADDKKAAKRNQSFRIIAATLIGGGLAINYMLFSYDPEKARLEAQRIAEENKKAVALAMASTIETTEDKIKKQFSSWDGSHYDLVRRTKRRMHDPSSFEHVRTTYTKKDEHLIVVMEYRGNNGFGAKTLDTAIAFYTIDGDYKGQLSQ